MARVFSDSVFEYVRIASHADLDATTAVTIMCWAYPTGVASGDWQHVISKWNLYLLRFADAAAPWKGWVFSTSVSGSGIAQEAVPSLNRWYHVAGTYDGTTSKLRVYDAVTKTVSNYTTAISGTIATNSNLLYLGSYQGTNEINRFNGRIAHAKMWKNLALSDAEIDLCRWYQGPYRALKVNMPILGASPEPDFSGNDHSGTVGGTSIADHPPIGPWFGFDPGGDGQVAPPPPSQTILDYERKFRGVRRGSWRGVA
ncbi:MAG: LamG domain-containing protein [Phycisphaerae bacterium]